jgi:hypothetical protein
VAGAAAAASPPPGSAAHRRADRRRAGRERQPAARGDRAAAPAAAGGITRGPPAAASRATGALDFNAVPWGYVSIDGLPEVETPIRARVLSVGRHRVRVRNPVLEREREVSVEIQAGETTRYVVDLRQ